jgi:hypothetical protein
VPPNQGKTHLLMIGWTWKTRNAPISVVAANQRIDWFDPILAVADSVCAD